MNNYTVYMHISPSNKRYIGITKLKPEYRWNNGKGYKENQYFTNAINKYDWDNFQHIIIAKGLTEDEAKWLEVELIREWDTTNKDKGYNLTKGGDGTVGYHHTEEWRQEHSERMSGKNNPNFGKPRSEETKQKIREANSGENGYWFGKGNFREGNKNPNAKKVICITTNEIFETITEGAKKYNCNRSHISSCCNGKYEYCGKHPITGEKLIWMYYDKYLKLLVDKR